MTILFPGQVGRGAGAGRLGNVGLLERPASDGVHSSRRLLHTGDLGVFDEDGFLTLKDRSNDVIISGGANIYPREVEEVLLRHPAVAQASVIGRPDREWGEAVVAYVVPAAGAGIDASALDDFCLEHIARFKRPKDYRVLDSLPEEQLREDIEDCVA